MFGFLGAQSLRFKLLSGFGAVTLFLLVIGGIGFLTSWRIEEAFRHMQTDTLVRRAYLADMRVNLQMIARFMNALSMPELTPAERARSQQQLEERIKLFQAAEGKYSSLPPVEGDKAYMDSIHAGEAAALEAVEAMVPLAASGNSGDRRRLYGLQRDRRPSHGKSH